MNDAMTIGRKRPAAFALAAVFLAVASAATLAALTTTASADPRDKWCKGVHLRFFVGGAEGYKGSSGLFNLDPVEGYIPARVASQGQEELYSCSFETLGREDWWMNQRRLIIGRNVSVIPPLMFPLDSSAFREWQRRPGFDFTVWAPFQQRNQ